MPIVYRNRSRELQTGSVVDFVRRTGDGFSDRFRDPTTWVDGWWPHRPEDASSKSERPPIRVVAAAT
ncbi:MAG: hypothetical protein DLM59_00440 [Pseudonocardiales bacterium]|nr:MAG: hypothetical protein DLM59_00440 [Pseudonocardiales bacterium]